MYVYVYVYIHIYIHICVYIYIYENVWFEHVHHRALGLRFGWWIEGPCGKQMPELNRTSKGQSVPS